MTSPLTEATANRTENSIKYTNQISDIEELQRHDFMSPRSFFLLDRLEVNTDFLQEDPNEWKTKLQSSPEENTRIDRSRERQRRTSATTWRKHNKESTRKV